MPALLLILSMFFGGFASASTLPKSSPVPGGIVRIDIDSTQGAAPEVYFQNRRVLVVPNGDGWQAVVGIPLSTAQGQQSIEVRQSPGVKLTREFEVRPKNYPTQRLTITDKRKVEPSAEDLKRIAREREITRQALRTWSDRFPDLGFLVPVDGRRSSSFGLRRFFNDKPRSPHKGMDIAAPEGTPVRVPAEAKVLHVGDFFFSGNVAYLDHGGGLVTMYAHLQDIRVEAGQTLQKGDVLGTVGKTGRVTGPHLHWAVYLNGTAVDPALFL